MYNVLLRRLLIELAVIMTLCASVCAAMRRTAWPNDVRPRGYRARHYENTTEFAARSAAATVDYLRVRRGQTARFLTDTLIGLSVND